jgi:hypothetical protein
MQTNARPGTRRKLMEDSRKKRIEALKERIFLLQVEERRLFAYLSAPRQDETSKVRAKEDLKTIRDLLSTMSYELKALLVRIESGTE